MLKLNLIVAACENNGIGYNGSLPWSIKSEWDYFNRMTTETEDPTSEKKNVILMGRTCFESKENQSAPLPGRINVVLSTKELNTTPEVWAYKSWESAMNDLASAEKQKLVDKIWVLGGVNIFKDALASPFFYRLYYTRIFAEFECDTFFDFDKDLYQLELVTDPKVPNEIQEDNGIRYQFEIYERINNSTSS